MCVDVARWAREQQRVVVTENVVDHVSLDERQHAGLLLLNARRWPCMPRGIDCIRAALDAWVTEPHDEQAGTVVWM
jgi:hypothetical protein